MKTFKIIAVLTLFVLTLFSCQSNTYEDISQKNVTNPTYGKNIKPIFDANCTSCHSQSGSRQSPNLETYLEVKDGCENGQVICRIDDQACGGEVMPQSGRMPQTTINLIKLWKAQGYEN